MKIRNCVIIWLSRIVLNLVSHENKSKFRKLKNSEKKKNQCPTASQIKLNMLKYAKLAAKIFTYVHIEHFQLFTQCIDLDKISYPDVKLKNKTVLLMNFFSYCSYFLNKLSL